MTGKLERAAANLIRAYGYSARGVQDKVCEALDIIYTEGTPDDARVLAYLRAENRYADAMGFARITVDDLNAGEGR